MGEPEVAPGRKNPAHIIRKSQHLIPGRFAFLPHLPFLQSTFFFLISSSRLLSSSLLFCSPFFLFFFVAFFLLLLRSSSAAPLPLLENLDWTSFLFYTTEDRDSLRIAKKKKKE
ncbi:uncharacterized protein ARB_07741 [Trichophyton benhamiae CBS 112371]|uniref:Transmembrane protein n=1 Tax=Arthroderma benhamiae (strain ATCC MYA-4681 / CBS 112371) TaxID=663331 RepID=D4AUB1_ARTBC|nr:uncharacterized protein ARB_07741 [Trichophyton benhamiae CBS 112371]EFE33381.1 hypothetical protein ARB_07741 [Trichophyton benhamiae CBS 112371]